MSEDALLLKGSALGDARVLYCRGLNDYQYCGSIFLV